MNPYTRSGFNNNEEEFMIESVADLISCDVNAKRRSEQTEWSDCKANQEMLPTRRDTKTQQRGYKWKRLQRRRTSNGRYTKRRETKRKRHIGKLTDNNVIV